MTGVPLDRLPDIDYTVHPVYGRSAPRPGVGARIAGYFRYAWIVGYLLRIKLCHFVKRRRWTITGPTPQLDALQRDGLVPLRMSREARTNMEGATRPYFDRLEERRRGVGPGHRKYADGQLDTTRTSAPELFAAVERMLTDAGILESVRAYLGSRAEVQKVTVQMNDEGDDFWRAPFEKLGVPLPRTAFFHVDNTYDLVKVILYMSDVTDTSGPFSYVPGTHKIRLGFVEGLLLRATDIWCDVWPQNRALILTLPRRFRRKAKFGDDIPAGDPWGQWLLEHERVVTSADGDMLLFDVMGIHRGGMVERGERRVVQIMMR